MVELHKDLIEGAGSDGMENICLSYTVQVTGIHAPAAAEQTRRPELVKSAHRVAG